MLTKHRGTDEAGLTALLSPFGELLEVTVIKDKASGESKGEPCVPSLHPIAPLSCNLCVCVCLYIHMCVCVCVRGSALL